MQRLNDHNSVFCRSTRIKSPWRRGFIAMYSFVLLLILGIFGISYWWVSRMSTDMIVKEAHRIKARNFAQAGIEKVMVNIMNQYNLGNHDLDYDPGFKFSVERIDKEYNVEFGDGSYAVDYVRPYEIPSSNRKMRGIPYYKNGIRIGHYDLWEVSVTGETSQSGIKATVRTIVKVICNHVLY